MSEMKSLTLNGETYDSFVDPVARSMGVINSVFVEIVVVSDSAGSAPVGFNIYGRSTQASEPTPSAPVNIVSVGDGGVIKCGLFGKNLFDASKMKLHKNASLSVIDDGYTIIATGGKGVIYASSRCELPLSLRGKRLCMVVDSIEKTHDSGSAQVTITTPDETLYYNVSEQRKSVSFTVPNNTTSLSIGVYTNNTSTELTVDSITTVKGLRLMLDVNNNDGWTKAVSEQAITLNHTLRGIPVTDGFYATYAGSSGQKWCADEIDLERGVLIQRIGVIGNYSGETVAKPYMSTTGQLTDGATVLYLLDSPNEIALADGEIAAYKALHTNKPNTTVLNDSGAYMKLEYVADTKSYIDNKVSSSILAATVE